MEGETTDDDDIMQESSSGASIVLTSSGGILAMNTQTVSTAEKKRALRLSGTFGEGGQSAMVWNLDEEDPISVTDIITGSQRHQGEQKSTYDATANIVSSAYDGMITHGITLVLVMNESKLDDVELVRL